MAENLDYSFEGLEELKTAVARNPEKVIKEVAAFFVRGMAVYNRRIIRNPWRMGERGGGAPKDTGNLRDTHKREIQQWQARIYPSAPYAAYVHGLNGKTMNSRGVQLRPWLHYAYAESDSEIMELEKGLLEKIVNNLAK
ncbi:MAG TPA: hypothetical protein VGE62_01075 [Candidatus Paceibacterota bacterium]